jgi:hypothetical protein
MEAIRSSETLITTSKTTRRQNPRPKFSPPWKPQISDKIYLHTRVRMPSPNISLVTTIKPKAKYRFCVSPSCCFTYSTKELTWQNLHIFRKSIRPTRIHPIMALMSQPSRSSHGHHVGIIGGRVLNRMTTGWPTRNMTYIKNIMTFRKLVKNFRGRSKQWYEDINSISAHISYGKWTKNKKSCYFHQLKVHCSTPLYYDI